MVKLTNKYIIQKVIKKSNATPRVTHEQSDWEILSKLTHLHLQSQFIDEIEPITDCHSVSVIYLQNNYLKRIHGIENFPRLTHLYLQRNQISKIENLQNSKFLKKIYLGHNAISVIEGLQFLPNLSELHIENQKLPLGETLYFDPRSIDSLARTLKFLNISDNNIRSLRCLSGLLVLETLIANNNQLDDLNDVADTLMMLPKLKKLNLLGNPVKNDRKYWDVIICSSKLLNELDGKEIQENSRVFVENLAANKESRMKLSKNDKSLEGFENFLSLAAFSNPKDVLKSCSSGSVGSKLFPAWKQHMNRNLKVKKSNLGSCFLEEIMKSNPF